MFLIADVYSEESDPTETLNFLLVPKLKLTDFGQGVQQAGNAKCNFESVVELRPELRRDSSVEPELQAVPKPKRLVSAAETGTGGTLAVVGTVELDPASHQTHLTQPDEVIPNPASDPSN